MKAIKIFSKKGKVRYYPVVCSECQLDLEAKTETDRGLIVYAELTNIIVEPCKECIRRAVERAKQK